jgi:uncharacterized cupredoxin-like copper-binding protein
MSLRLHRLCVACATGAALALVAAACGGRSAGNPAPVPVVHVTERDFAIKAPHHVKAGIVRFVTTNTGPVSHELLLVRAPHGRLPMRTDGLTVDEEVLGRRIVLAFEPDGPGGVRARQVRLAPGRYVLICNMAGHYMSGMSSPLLVR